MYRTPAFKPVPYKKSRFAGLRRRILAFFLKYRLFVALALFGATMFPMWFFLLIKESWHVIWFTPLAMLLPAILLWLSSASLTKYPQKFLVRIFGHGFYPFT